MTQAPPWPPSAEPGGAAPHDPGPPGSNLPEYRVSELSRALKRTVEDAYGYVRVRGEVSQPKRHGSGHLYLRLKDESAVLEAVCWKGTTQALAVQPEDGMEVVCTGRLTTYPGRSQYQLIIERLELAGVGALLKLLEDRKRRLADEGLFAAERKRPLPFLPETIGVITSPTGAVLRDILHRLADRFPRPVLLWPVAVQGEAAAAQVAAAIDGFNRLERGGAVARPDLLIVARGGGSLEDLMPFNEEIVVRAAAASRIPLISAVGHETDTTLIDLAADRRAPTPTAAAEIAVPVRAELLAGVLDRARRLFGCASRGVADRRTLVAALARGLGDPQDLIDDRAQRLDDRATRLGLAVVAVINRQRAGVKENAGRLRHPRQVLLTAAAALAAEARALQGALRHALLGASGRYEHAGARLSLRPIAARLAEAERGLADLGGRIGAAGSRLVAERAARLKAVGDLMESYSFRRTLERGFALIVDADGERPLTSVASAKPGLPVVLTFHDGAAPAVIDPPAVSRPSRGGAAKSVQPIPAQGRLL